MAKDIVRWFLTRRMVTGIDLKNNPGQFAMKRTKITAALIGRRNEPDPFVWGILSP